MTTCFPASGFACTRPMRGRCRPLTSAVRRRDLARHARAADDRKLPARQRARPAMRRWPWLDPTKPLVTTSWPWSCGQGRTAPTRSRSTRPSCRSRRARRLPPPGTSPCARARPGPAARNLTPIRRRCREPGCSSRWAGSGCSPTRGSTSWRCTTEALPLVPTEPASPLRARILSLHARAKRPTAGTTGRALVGRGAADGHELGLADVRPTHDDDGAHRGARREIPSPPGPAGRDIEEAGRRASRRQNCAGLFDSRHPALRVRRVEAALAVFQTAADRAVQVSAARGRRTASSARSMAASGAYVGGQWD